MNRRSPRVVLLEKGVQVAHRPLALIPAQKIQHCLGGLDRGTDPTMENLRRLQTRAFIIPTAQHLWFSGVNTSGVSPACHLLYDHLEVDKQPHPRGIVGNEHVSKGLSKRWKPVTNLGRMNYFTLVWQSLLSTCVPIILFAWEHFICIPSLHFSSEMHRCADILVFKAQPYRKCC